MLEEAGEEGEEDGGGGEEEDGGTARGPADGGAELGGVGEEMVELCGEEEEEKGSVKLRQGDMKKGRKRE